MNVLVIGSGGREHALADKLAESSHVKKLICAPGNAGTARIAENVAIDIADHAALADLAIDRKIDLTVVGPEMPLCDGIVDRFESAGLRIFGPNKAAARIEGDKSYAKDLMRRCMVPTAEGKIFTDFNDAKAYAATRDIELVVKASGLAAGKGVVICDDPADAINTLEDIMVKGAFGQAGQKVIVEEKLQGKELSMFALVDGFTIYILEAAQDHKRVGDGDTGLNTGGMGAFCPSPLATSDVFDQVQRDILVPMVDALRCDGAPYRGLLYIGLMLTPGGPKVLEFNCRFGDPECQVMMARLKGDLFEIMQATATGKLDQVSIDWDPRPAISVVMASGGYPGAYQKGKLITGLGEAAAVSGVKIHHAATAPLEDMVVTNGGRVLCVTAIGNSMAKAREQAYKAVDLIHFEDAHYRRDIAAGL